MSVSTITLPAQFQPGVYAPVFDPAGTLAANLVSGEAQVVAANFGTDLQFLVPSYAPFYAASFVLTYTDPNTNVTSTLQAARDYFFAFPFISASRATNLSVYGGVVIANNKLAGTFTMSYQTVGGVWVSSVSIDQAVELLITVDPYVTAWEQVISYDSAFPVITSPWDKPDLKNFDDLINAVLSLRDTVAETAENVTSANEAALAHIFNFNNPHQDSAVQIGLDLVANYPAATDTQAGDPNNNSTYITPAQLKIAFAGGMPLAQDTVRGKMALNVGANPTIDAVDNQRALTAQGFVNLVQSPNNPLGSSFNKGQVEATFNPPSFMTPCIWNGVQYNSIPDLIAAIENFVGIHPLEFSYNQSKIWFPYGTTVPDLTVTQVSF